MSNETTVGLVEIKDVVIGFSYTFLSLLESLLYVPCLIVMRTDQELKSLSCFRCMAWSDHRRREEIFFSSGPGQFISLEDGNLELSHGRDVECRLAFSLKMMFHLGLADMCNMICQAIAGILIMARWAYTMPYWMNQVFGAIHTSFSWFWYITLVQVIAINRCVTICMPGVYKFRFFSDKPTTYWLIGCFAHAAVWFIVLVTPKCSFILIPEAFTFYYDETFEWADEAKNVAWYAENLILNTSIVWYVIIFVYLRSQTNSMTTGSEQQTENQKKERKILYQAALICVYTMVWNQYWHLEPYLYDKYNFVYAYAVGNLLWISNSAINPLMYMTMNKTIKRKVKRMLFCDDATVHPVTGATITRNRGARNSNRIGKNQTYM